MDMNLKAFMKEELKHLRTMELKSLRTRMEIPFRL